MYDIIIIGAGPAGTAAGIYAARQGLNFLIITKDIGGQIGKKAVDIENYPGFNKISGSDLVKIFEEQLKKNQVKIILGEVLKISAKGQPASGGEGPKLVGSLTYLDTKSNKENILETDGIFVEVGYSPATAFAKSLVDFSDRDEIMVQPETFQTKTTGLFAVGDCNMGKYKQIVTAAGEGAKASLAVYEYLKRNSNGKN